jgi:L-amino acid N-acyltransferase YncA
MKNLLVSLHRFVMSMSRPSKQFNLGLLSKNGETLSSFKIRDAVIDDIPALATLHVKVWRETYWTSLSAPTYETRARQWEQQFKETDGSWFCLVVENKNGELIGFAKGNSYNHADLPEFSGELNKIYLLRKYQRIGLGRKLMEQVATKFLLQGISNMVLFGTPENPSCKFHDAMGGEQLYGKNGEFHGGYCWTDLRNLTNISSSR